MLARFRKVEVESPLQSVQWVWDSEGQPRWSTKPFTPEVQALAHNDPHLYNADLGYLCADAPINFIGSLFLLQQKAYLAPIIEAKEKLGAVFTTFHQCFAQPFQLMANVPLYRLKKTERQSTDLIAPLVFQKRASGKAAGVILQGPLTGLMLQPLPPTDLPQEGMIINRIWNDQRLTGTDHPYWTPVHALQGGLYNRVTTQLEREFAALVNRSWPYHPWSSQVFLQLCQQFNIPVDTWRFQTLRAAKDLPRLAASAPPPRS